MMKIGIKYCGGCNPRFDRVGLVAQLKEAFPGWEFLSAGAPEEFDFIAVICGCTSRCAAHDGLEGRYGKFVLDRREDYGRLCQQMAEAEIKYQNQKE